MKKKKKTINIDIDYKQSRKYLASRRTVRKYKKKKKGIYKKNIYIQLYFFLKYANE